MGKHVRISLILPLLFHMTLHAKIRLEGVGQ